MDEWETIRQDVIQYFYEPTFLDTYRDIVGHRTAEEVIALFEAIPKEYLRKKKIGPLHIAAKLDDDRVLGELISFFHDSIEKSNGSGKTPLVKAIKRENLKVIAALLKGGATLSNERYKRKIGPLHQAAWRRKSKSVKMLLEAGADVNALDAASANPLAWLMIKSKILRLEVEITRLLSAQELYNNYGAFNRPTPEDPEEIKNIAKILIEHGANVNQVDKRKNTPLHLAIEHGLFDIADMLLDAGACAINANKDDSNTPLHLALREKEIELAKLILKFDGFDLNAVNKDNRNPLCYAIMAGSYEMVNILIAAGASTDLSRIRDFCPVREAIRTGDWEFVVFISKIIRNIDLRNTDDIRTYPKVATQYKKMFVDLFRCEGFRRSRNDDNDMTYFQVATYCGYKVMFAQLLKRRGNKRSRKADNPMSYLQFAAHCGRKEVFVNLLNYGGNLACRGRNGKTLLHYASDWKSTHYSGKASRDTERAELIKFILSQNADGLSYSTDEVIEILNDVVEFADEEVASSLLKLLGDLSQYPTSMFEQLFIKAAGNVRYSRVVELIYESVKIDVNALDENGLNALDRTIRREWKKCDPRVGLVKCPGSSSASIIKFLIGLGVHTGCEKTKRDRFLPLQLAILTGRYEYVRSLLMCKPDIDIEKENFEHILVSGFSRFWRTALELAVYHKLENASKSALYLVRHIALLQAIGKPVREESLEMIHEKPDLQSYYDTCKTELSSLRECKICDSLTLFDVLNGVRLNSSELDLLEDAIACKTFDCLQVYDDIVEYHISRARECLKFVEDTRNSLGRIFKCNPLSQIVVIEKILRYLDHKDLRCLIRV